MLPFLDCAGGSAPPNGPRITSGGFFLEMLMIILTRPQTINYAIEQCRAVTPVQILHRYRELLETEPIAWLFVLQNGDTACCLETLRGRPFTGWEFINHDNGWYEAVFIISDDGFGHVVLIPDQPDTDPTLRALCEAHSA